MEREFQIISFHQQMVDIPHGPPGWVRYCPPSVLPETLVVADSVHFTSAHAFDGQKTTGNVSLIKKPQQTL